MSLSNGKGPTLGFEKPLLELEDRIRNMREAQSLSGVNVNRAVEELVARRQQEWEKIRAGLSPWERVQLARHPQRPTSVDYIQRIFDDFTELHGDRLFRDDPAIVGGFASLGERKLVVIGHQKGRDTKSNIRRNFGMAHPEGYRKALRLMEMAARFGRPVVTFIDTPGAYPGVGAEERGQAEAIARNLREMAMLETPILVIVTGEGGSGGALALGVGDRVYMMENSIYSVISPEGCAAILWRDRAKAEEAAAAMKLTAADAERLGAIDGILSEPVGGAHRDHEAAAAVLKETIVKTLDELEPLGTRALLDARLEKFLAMGIYEEQGRS